MARGQDAPFREPRIAVNLARPRTIRRRNDGAKQIPVPVQARFTDGYETSGATLDCLPP